MKEEEEETLDLMSLVLLICLNIDTQIVFPFEMNILSAGCDVFKARDIHKAHR